MEKFASDQERLDKSTSVSMSLIGLFVFGGTDPETGFWCMNAFGVAFSKEKNLQSWRKVGAATITRALLKVPKV